MLRLTVKGNSIGCRIRPGATPGTFVSFAPPDGAVTLEFRAALECAFAASPGEDQRVAVVENAPHSFMIPSDDGPPRYAEGVFSGMAEWLEARGLTGQGC